MLPDVTLVAFKATEMVARLIELFGMAGAEVVPVRYWKATVLVAPL
jgi:hypothetical protein